MSDIDHLSANLSEYVGKALSMDNRADGEPSPYMVRVEFAEYGTFDADPPGFNCCVIVPRQANNELGMTQRESITNRTDAAAMLRSMADLIEKGEGDE